ncbi:hypothetical protein D3C87_1193610 [compost metagenome]
MKKFLFGAVCALTVSSTAFGQMYGNDKGNGGDAVMINNELVMRDFVSRSNLALVPDSLAFVKSIPDLSALISEIGEVNSEFALSVLSELVHANFYNSSASLNVLPAATTAVGGPAALVQLAVRWDNDIVLAPEFKTFKEKSYLLVHEALHGVNTRRGGGGGALHHERVRSVVNYLKANRGHYTSESLAAVLEIADLPSGESLKAKVVWDKKSPPDVRCMAGYRLASEKVFSYLGVKCPELDIRAKSNYFRKEIDFSYLGEQASYFESIASYDTRNIEIVKALRLPEVSFLQRNALFIQRSDCRSNMFWMESDLGYSKAAENSVRVNEDLIKFFSRSDIPLNARLFLKEYFSQDGAKDPFKESLSLARADLQIYAKNRATRLANQKRCVAKFGKEVLK